MVGGVDAFPNLVIVPVPNSWVFYDVQRLPLGDSNGIPGFNSKQHILVDPGSYPHPPASIFAIFRKTPPLFYGIYIHVFRNYEYSMITPIQEISIILWQYDTVILKCDTHPSFKPASLKKLRHCVFCGFDKK